MNKKIRNLVSKSLCTVLIISALILSFNLFSNAIIIAGQDKVCGEIVKSIIFNIAGQDKVCGEIVRGNIIDVAQDKVCGEIV